ncbi:MAG: prepilin-type N-terminal cleavage/methylation domain-containing protein [Verrucomicrobiia bacterium]
MPDKGFTLPEILIATMVFLLMVAGIIAANLFGLQMFQITTTKLNVTTWSRETVEAITTEVQGCNSVWVGNITTNGVFQTLLDGETQQGTGLLIYPTTNTTNYIIYFLNPSDQTFRRTTSQPGTAEVLADSVTNTLVFAAQDFSGNVLTNNENNRVIHLTLEFYQPALFTVGADYYKLETSVTRRALQ